MKNNSSYEQMIGYEFKDKALFEKALTHSSYIKAKGMSRLAGNERLEFLGDAFLDAIIGETLFLQFPEAEEGFLTKVRAAVVCEKTLAQEARRIKIGQMLKISKGEEKTGGRDRDSIIADAMEAIIGAIYLDRGYEATKDYVLKVFDSVLEEIKAGNFSNMDYKSQIQEALQAKGILNIRYGLEKEEGPDHDKTFYVYLKADDKVLGRGKGKSKKEAEQNAAKDGLERGTNVF